MAMTLYRMIEVFPLSKLIEMNRQENKFHGLKINISVMWVRLLPVSYGI